MYTVEFKTGVSQKTSKEYSYLVITLHGQEIKRVFLNDQEAALVKLLKEKFSSKVK